MRSQLIGLIGTGIAPSLSPPLHEREADALGLRYLYRRLDLDELGLPAAAVGEVLAAARLTGYTGLNVTHPAKRLVLDHLDDISPDAAVLGAVNTVVLHGGAATGHNTDATGFARGFSLGLPDAPLDEVVLLGAGGAGAAVIRALLSLGATKIRVFDHVLARAEALAEAFGARVRAQPVDELHGALSRADGFVHATPTGMREHPGSAVPPSWLRPRLWVADVVYRPLETALVATARELGCRVLPGGNMAVFQAADSFRLFTGIEPDTGRMLRHFAELTAQEGATHV